jgi:arginase family enzyme
VGKNEDGTRSDFAIMGAALDHYSTRTRGQSQAPFAIRAYEDFESWVDPYAGDLGEVSVVDVGDYEADMTRPHLGYTRVANGVHSLLGNTEFMCLLGGDHTVTAYALQGVRKHLGPTVRLNVVHLDAHSDTWGHDNTKGFPHHGSWVRKVLEDRTVDAVFQLGVRALGPDSEAGIEDRIVRIQPGNPFMDLDRSAQHYLSVDMDVVDPAFAPGVAYREPGGWTSELLLRTVESLVSTGRFIGMDIVETIPDRDRDQLTVGLAHRTILAALKGYAKMVKK